MWDLTKILKFGWYFEANCVIWFLDIFLSPKLNSCRFSGWILDVMTENCKKMGKSSQIVHRRVSSDFENLESLIFTGPVLYRFSIDHSEVEKVFSLFANFQQRWLTDWQFCSWRIISGSLVVTSMQKYRSPRWVAFVVGKGAIFCLWQKRTQMFTKGIQQ